MTHPPVTLKPLGRFYLYETTSLTGGRFMAETMELPRGADMTLGEALYELSQDKDIVAVWECTPDEGTMRDVSEDMAREYMEALLESRTLDIDPENACTWPAFCSRHLTTDEVYQIMDLV